MAGPQNLMDSASACCESCRAHRNHTTAERGCNVWVWCGDASTPNPNPNPDPSSSPTQGPSPSPSPNPYPNPNPFTYPNTYPYPNPYPNPNPYPSPNKVVHEGHARKPLVWLRVYSGEVRRTEAATLWHPVCNPMWCRLQPYPMHAATLCDARCNPM